MHSFQIITNLLYVCQSVSWLTFLLKLHKCRDISCSGRDIFLKIFGDIPGMFLHYSQMITHFLYVCKSVSWLTSLLKWYVFLIFWDIPEMFVHFYQIITNLLYVCLSVSWLTYLLKWGQYRDISCPGWDIFLNFFGDIPWMFLHHFPIIKIVCMSVSLLVGLLPYWN